MVAPLLLDTDSEVGAWFWRRETCMLSVGRELEITDKHIVCLKCLWHGAGAELSAGLVQVTSTPMYCYAYRCPKCLSFNLTRKGKLLQFGKRAILDQEDQQGLKPVPRICDLDSTQPE